MLCQLKGIEEALVNFSFFDRLKRKIIYLLCFIKSKIYKENSTYSQNTNNISSIKTPSQNCANKIIPLNLRAGELVKVKSVEEIKRTLDQNNKYQGLAYTPVMWKFCGGTYTVLKKVELVFDERKWKLSKVKNIVLLDGVFCDGVGGIEKAWDGCDRTCFIWWKEGWLERLQDK